MQLVSAFCPVASEYVPVPHFEHVDSDDCPVAVEYLPAAH
jgi:hypothetical protein